MKVMGKFAALAGAALLLGTSVAFADEVTGADYNLPEGLSFKYTLQSDLVRAHNMSSANRAEDDYEWWSEFGGLENVFEINYNSDLLGFKLKPTVKIGEPDGEFGFGWALNQTAKGAGAAFASVGDYNKNYYTVNRDKLNSDDTGFFYSGFDWSLHFTPFDFLEIGLKEGYDIAGGGLSETWGRYSSAKLGSDGLTLLLKPIQGLRLAASLPFTFAVASAPDMLNAEWEDADYTPPTSTHLVWTKKETGAVKFKVKIGADYNFKNLFSVGATWNDILDANDMQVGIYGNITAIQNLNIGLGYTFNRQSTGEGLVFDLWTLGWNYHDMFKIYGQHVAQLEVSYRLGNLSLMAQGAFNFFQNQSVYDMFAGLKVGYDLVPGRVNIGVVGTVAMDFGTQLAWNDSDGNVFNAAESRTGNKAKITDPDFEQSYLNKRGTGDKAMLYRYANSDWKLANNLKANGGNATRGLTGVDTDWAGYSAAMVISVKPTVSFTAGNNKFDAGMVVDYLPTAANDYYVNSTTDNITGDWFFKFPVSWTYNFR